MATEKSTIISKKYHGNCHCGTFRFSINIPSLELVRSCNCSICTRNGYLWIFPIPEKDLVIQKGEGILKEYEFGNKSMTHMFCPICGTSVMARRRNAPVGRAIGINARVLQDIDLEILEVEKFKGAELDPPYQPPVPIIEPVEATDGTRTYQGGCHCGAATFSVKTEPLSKMAALSCNCSLCSRNGDLWIYPKKVAVDLKGDESLTDYAFLDPESLHSFCSICGVSVIVKVFGKSEEDEICPINVRTIEGIDVNELTLKRYNGKKNDPQYFLRH